MKSRFRVISDVGESGEVSIPTMESDRPRIPPHLCDQWSSIGSTVGILILMGIGALFLDLSVSWGLNQQHLLKPIHRTLEMAEPFGDFAGVILVAIGIGILKPTARRHLPLLLLGVATAGLAADVLKLMVGRIRPTNLDWSVVRTVGDTFTGWMPFIHGGWKNQSFPSAHTATAWGLAMLLVRMFPRGKWFFPVVAFFVGFQRVETGSHYLSDTIFGTAIGIGVSCSWLKSRLFSDFLPVSLIERDSGEGDFPNGEERNTGGKSSVGGESSAG